MDKADHIKSELERKNVVCGCMVSEVRTPAIGMILESAGLDFFILDMEHGSFSYETANDIIVSCRGLNIVPFVRVPSIEREVFQKPLDAGALGLILPRIETREQVENALELIRYAPLGSRGLSLRRAHSGFVKHDPAEFTARANRSLIFVVQIETKRGIENIEDICDAGAIDVMFVGPSDLAHSYGNLADEQLEQAVERVIRVGKERGITTGIHHSNLSYVLRRIADGMRFVSVNTEVGAIISVFSDMSRAIRSAAMEPISGEKRQLTRVR